MTREQFKILLEKRILILDGAMGTFLIEAGLAPGQAPEEFNLIRPEAVLQAHRNYIAAGADIVLSNTFGGSAIKLSEFGLQDKTAEINVKGVEIARQAGDGKALIAGCIGPCGRYLPPIGTLDFDEAVNTFREQALILIRAGIDVIVVETMSDIREMRACLIGIREIYEGPIIAHITFPDGFTTITGTGVETAAAIIEALNVDAVGINCSTGVKEMLPLVETMVKSTHLPISVEPNAGMPRLTAGKTVYPETPAELADFAVKCAEIGVNLIGACCGSVPAHIAAIKKAVGNTVPMERNIPRRSRLCSRDKTVVIDDARPTVFIGERINPTGRKKFTEALAAGNMSEIRHEAGRQAECGASILDVNVGVPGADEPALMRKAVRAVQSIVSVPLALDSSNVLALEAGLKEIEGKPLLNSVTAEAEKLHSVIPLAKKYGAAILGLPLDEKGIPETVEGRLKLGKKIVEAALEVGIAKADIYLDGLTLTVSADTNAPKITLETIRRFKAELGVHTVLGVSNVSFGLPNRQQVNAAFLSMALVNGLDLPIINPYSQPVMEALKYSDLLTGKDYASRNFLAYVRGLEKDTDKQTLLRDISLEDALKSAIILGNQESAVEHLKKLLKHGKNAFDINDQILIPAMMEVGWLYDKKEIFLPQVIMSAEAMHAAFEILKPLIKGQASVCKGRVIMATVKGDVHDIGKNIIAAMMENYGYEVIDLGKNICSGEIIAAVRNHRADLVGLSALMTTTMGVMRDMVREIKAEARVKIIIGGAVVTRKFAEEIGADGYAKDASEAVSEIAVLLKNTSSG